MAIRIKDTRVLSEDYYLLKKTTFELQQRDEPNSLRHARTWCGHPRVCFRDGSGSRGCPG